MRVAVVEDSALLRRGLAEVLRLAGFDVVLERPDAIGLIDALREHAVEVVVLDIRMPPTHTREGLDAARLVRSEFGTDIGIVLLTQHVEVQHAVDLLAGGAGGVAYLLKDRVLDVDELADALRRVHHGGSVIDPTVIERMLSRQTAEHTLSRLTEREGEVLAALAEGRSNQSIAANLHLSQKTVEAHISSIFVKLDLEPTPDDHRRVRAVLAYLNATSGHDR